MRQSKTGDSTPPNLRYGMDARTSLVIPGTVGAPPGEAIVRGARAAANAGLDHRMLRALEIASRRAASSALTPRVPLSEEVSLWHELGCDAGADNAAAGALVDRLTRAGSASTAALPLSYREGARPSPRISFQSDDLQERAGD